MEVQWPLVIFTLFVCCGAGIFALQGLLTFLGKSEKTQVPAVISSAVIVALGGIASFMHLHHWDRAFNGFAQISSGITQELMSIAVLFVALAIFFFVGRNKLAPKWAGIMAILISLLVVVLMTTSYMMPARPVWASPLLYLFYLAQAFAVGSACLWLLTSLKKDEESAPLMVKCTAIGGALVVLSLAAYAIYIAVVNPVDLGNTWNNTAPTVSQATASLISILLAGEGALFFWGAVLLGGLAPAILAFLKWKNDQANVVFAAISVACILVGGVLFRAALYVVGFTIFPTLF